MLILKAPAKINLVLEALGRRRDGFHEVRSILQAVDLCDRLVFDHFDGFSLECDNPALETPDNLVLKAAHRMRLVTGYEGGASIKLVKNIPSGVGLGGGSSDAAATIRGLNTLWRQRLSRSQLQETAALVGSDVPFFIRGGLARIEGRGEWVKQLPDAKPQCYLVSIPPVAIPHEKTRRLYMKLIPKNYTDGKRSAAAARVLRLGGTVDESLLFNVFESVAFDAFPGLAAFWKKLEQITRRRVNLCGSGPAMYVIMEATEAVQGAAARLSREGLKSYAVGPEPTFSHEGKGVSEGTFST